MSKYEFCLGRMARKGDAKVCPKCGYVEGTPQVLPYLTPGTKLAEHYVVGRTLSANGEGVSYIGMDLDKGKRVVIREYLPATLCRRESGSDKLIVNSNAELVYNDYLSDFVEVSRAVSRLADIPAILPVRDIFECNNTAYTVYDYVAGKSLSELVKRAKRLTWDEAKPLFMPLISAMSAAHSIGLVHFGISPDNIIMTKDSRLVLTGFGVPDARIAETELQPEMFDGYSAIEQYALDGKKGKWTDVYAMSAVLLFALTGKRPPDAVARSYEPRLNVSAQLAETIPAYVISAIANGLQVQVDNRTPSMDRFRSDISAGGRDESVRAAEPRERTMPAAGHSRVDVPQMIRRAAGSIKHGAERFEGENKWYRNLSQFQYLLLSTCLGIIVLGTIGLILFLSVIRPSLDRNKTDNPSIIIAEKGDTSSSDFIDETKLVSVPKLIGKKLTDVRNGDGYVDIEIIEEKTTDNSDYSDDCAEGVIMWQSIEEGTTVNYGTPVAVKVSLGSRKCTIPNIINMTVSEANDALEKAGLHLGVQKEEYNSSVAMLHIIAITSGDGSLSVGSRVDRGSYIDVVVSLGEGY